jgi:hypothetical protein
MPKKIRKKRTCLNPCKKGGAWERAASVALSVWISKSFGDARDDLIWRSAGSGSRATKAKKTGKSRGSQAGDLVANDERAQKFLELFLVECKSYANIRLEGLIWRSSAKPLNICFDAPIEQAREHAKWPLLVLKQNQRTPILVLPRKIAKLVTDSSGLSATVHVVRDTSQDLEYFSIFPMPDFLEMVDFGKFIRLVPKRIV